MKIALALWRRANWPNKWSKFGAPKLIRFQEPETLRGFSLFDTRYPHSCWCSYDILPFRPCLPLPWRIELTQKLDTCWLLFKFLYSFFVPPVYPSKSPSISHGFSQSPHVAHLSTIPRGIPWVFWNKTVTPSHHPFLDGIFHDFSLINPPFGGTPICGNPPLLSH